MQIQVDSGYVTQVKTRTRKRNQVGQNRWKKEIAEVSKYAATHHGFKAELALRLGKRFRDRDKNWRVMLDTWLTTNDDRRTEPLAGTGLIVVAEAKELMEEWQCAEQKAIVA